MPRRPNENPGSSGWANGPDPETWNKGPLPTRSRPLDAYASLDDEFAMELEPELSVQASLEKESWAWLLPVLRAVGPMLTRAAPGVAKDVAKGVAVNQLTKSMQPDKPEQPEEPEDTPEPGQRHVDRRANPLSFGAVADAELHDEPEPALPSTDGGEEDLGVMHAFDSQPRTASGPGAHPLVVGNVLAGAEDSGGTALGNAFDTAGAGESVPSNVQDIVARFQASAAASKLMAGGGSKDASDIAAAAKEHLAKTSLKEFTPAERSQMINEGGGMVRARNLDSLDITGTHYEHIGDDDDEEGWLG